MLFKLKGKVIYRWVISYVLILIIPTSLGVALLANTQKIVIAEYKSMSQVLYQQIGKVIDIDISRLDTIRNLLISNAELNYFSTLMPEVTAENWYSLIKIQKQLSSYATSYNTDKFYIYIDNIDKVLTPYSLYSKELTFSKYHSKSSIDIKEWFEYINQYHSRTIRVIKDKDSSNCTAIMITSIPNMSIYKPRAVIVQILEGDVFSRLIKDVVIDEYTELLLLDKDDNIIVSNSEAGKQSKISYENLKHNLGHIELELEGERKLIFYQDSSVRDWKYVTMVSKDAISNKIGKIRLYTLSFFIFSIVTGYILSYFMAHHNYNPIRRIIKRITPYVQNNCDKYEYDQIEDAFTNIIVAKENLDKLCKNQALLIQNNFIESLLKGQISDSDQIRDIIASFDIHFKSDMFCVLIFCAETAQDKGKELESNFMYEFFMRIEKVLRKEIPAEIDMYPVEMDSLMAVLVNFGSGFTEQTYHEMCNHILNLTTSYEERIFITASKVCRGLSIVYLSYSEAMEAMNYNLLIYRDDPSAINNLNIESNSCGSYIYSIQQEEQLINKLCSGNTTGALKLFDEICWNNIIQNRISFNLSRCLLYDITSSAFKVLNKQADIDASVFIEIDQLINKLNKTKSSREMCKTVERILIITGQNVQKTYNKLSLHDEIISCVNQHFCESDFNVSKVAEYLSMNISYISKYFKDNTGVGLLDYINRVRINYAKDLLSSEDVSVSDVSAKVGFENLNSFIRVFKKYEEITPGLYREKIKI